MKALKYFLVMCLSAMSFAVLADYRMIVPQRPGGGTDVWARIVAAEWEKKLGERIIVVNIPGINDIPGFNQFHNELRKDSKTIMVAHGGNAESYLLHEVDYDYHQYQPIGLQNLTIMTGKRSDSDPYEKLKFAAGSGMNPDLMAMTMLICGPQPDMKAYLKCYQDRVVYVPGMKGNERRLAYLRGELNATRESPASYFKHSRKVPENQDWFNHGVLDIETGEIVDDPNFPGMLFSEVYKQKWGVYPAGDFYNAYLLVKQYRDVLQKSLWVDSGNPNAQVLIDSLKATLADPVSRAAIEKQTGTYQWLYGDQVLKAMDTLEKLTTKRALKDLVWWTSVAFNQQAYYKDNIAVNAK